MNFNTLLLTAFAIAFSVKCSKATNDTQSAQTIEFNLTCITSNPTAGLVFQSETDEMLSKISEIYECGCKNGRYSLEYESCISHLNLPDNYERIIGNFNYASFLSHLKFKNSIKSAADSVCEAHKALFEDSMGENSETVVYSSKKKLKFIPRVIDESDSDLSKNDDKKDTFVSYNNFHLIIAFTGGSLLVLIILGIYLLVKKLTKASSEKKPSSSVEISNESIVDFDAPPAYDNFATRTPSFDSKKIDPSSSLD